MFQALCLTILLLLVVIDQLTKIITEIWLKPIGSLDLIGGFIGFSYVRNTGAAFGVLQNGAVALSVITAIVLIVILYFLLSGKIKSKIEYFALLLIASGGIGNIIDRIFRGYVVDFLEFKFISFPVFNFADCLITTGSAIFIIYLIYDMIIDYKKQKEQNKAVQAGEAEIKK